MGGPRVRAQGRSGLCRLRLWYGLTVLRIVCPVLMLRALPYMFVEEAKNPNTLKAKKWYGEYCAAWWAKGKGFML